MFPLSIVLLTCVEDPLWRGSLLPLVREADPKQVNTVTQLHRVYLFYDGFAAEREQAPSPQVSVRFRYR